MSSFTYARQPTLFNISLYTMHEPLLLHSSLTDVRCFPNEFLPLHLHHLTVFLILPLLPANTLDHSFLLQYMRACQLNQVMRCLFSVPSDDATQPLEAHFHNGTLSSQQYSLHLNNLSRLYDSDQMHISPQLHLKIHLILLYEKLNPLHQTRLLLNV